MPPPKQWPVRRDNGRDTPARWCIATANAARRSYRANVGHDLGNVDPYTNVPLAARVCYDVAGLQFSFQTDKFQDIVDYTDGNLGPLLSALCGFCWFVKVCRRAPHTRPLPVVTWVRPAPVMTPRAHRGCQRFDGRKPGEAHASDCSPSLVAPSCGMACNGCSVSHIVRHVLYTPMCQRRCLSESMSCERFGVRHVVQSLFS